MKKPLTKGIQKFDFDSEVLSSLIVDLIDSSLYEKIREQKSTESPDITFNQNQEFWEHLLFNKGYETQIVKLNNFHILEWIPLSPGLFWTEKSKQLRGNAFIETITDLQQTSFSLGPTGFKAQSKQLLYMDKNGDIIYTPRNKAKMIQGGIGSLRLSAKQILGNTSFLLCATSSGVSHEGIPVLIEESIYKLIISGIKEVGGAKADLVGRLRKLPVEFSKVEFNRQIPKFCIEIEDIINISQSKTEELTASAAINYYSSEFPDNKFWSFYNFNPDPKGEGLAEATEWLQHYSESYTKIKNPIYINDFDEYIQHFESVEFSLKDILNGNISAESLAKYNLSFNIQNKKIMGDEIKIENSNIGAVGSNAQSHNNVFQNLNNKSLGDLDFEKVYAELGQLKQKLSEEAETEEEQNAVLLLEEAQEAAEKKDSKGVMGKLKSVGGATLQAARDIGVDIAAEVIKKSMYP